MGQGQSTGGGAEAAPPPPQLSPEAGPCVYDAARASPLDGTESLASHLPNVSPIGRADASPAALSTEYPTPQTDLDARFVSLLQSPAVSQVPVPQCTSPPAPNAAQAQRQQATVAGKPYRTGRVGLVYKKRVAFDMRGIEDVQDEPSVCAESTPGASSQGAAPPKSLPEGKDVASPLSCSTTTPPSEAVLSIPHATQAISAPPRRAPAVARFPTSAFDHAMSRVHLAKTWHAEKYNKRHADTLLGDAHVTSLFYLEERERRIAVALSEGRSFRDLQEEALVAKFYIESDERCRGESDSGDDEEGEEDSDTSELSSASDGEVAREAEARASVLAAYYASKMAVELQGGAQDLEHK